ncbi:MAG: SDR family NAD(P)-dependent oxidoreductase [Bacteroidales bacterium]|jgi:NAD(P)-dependent dehydrogenase (short-subunit alcohol dehydrogenase family)|nr:SDR family NAD(P)-dependent oxidoreductase [Bacteroidales bacterium]
MKVAIITGADGGMGQIHTLEIVKAGFHVIMACHDLQKAEPVYQKLKAKSGDSIILLPLALNSFATIFAFAEAVKKEYDHIDLLLNNAGTLCHAAEATEEGIEMTMGVNYLGTYLLTRLLLPLMNEGTRIVSMGSLSYRWFKLDDTILKPISGRFERFKHYSRSKRALLFFTLDAAEAWAERGISVNYADPGIVSTKIIRMGIPFIDKLCDIFFRPFIKSPAKGAATMLYLALSPETADITGAYYANKKAVAIPEKFRTSAERSQLRILTQNLFTQHHIVLPC